MPSPSCAILVLNWNGVEHLRVLIPSLRAAVASLGAPVPIVVVDNRSTQSDVEWLRRECPDVEAVVAERNDFLFSLNPVVAGRSEEAIVILNNDMRVDADFLAPLLAHFDDPGVFAATARVLDWDGTRQTTGQRRMAIRNCWYYQWWDLEVRQPVYTLDAGGGCAAFRRTFFVELGGFDPLYRPGYFEDVDLSYRAWMRGWRTVFEPRSVIYHREGATLQDRSREARFRTLLARNQALFTLKNIGGWLFVIGYLALAPFRLLRSDPYTARGLIRAAPRAVQALLNRVGRRPPVMTPRQIAAAAAATLP
ncbi:MAG TPA: glycosyltransferase [Gemmatimonadaceae bacterium]|jgi:GT2 family glycosyltransferase|nr:glycosyltransferase [Gemmatimonadaceae bacterium]